MTFETKSVNEQNDAIVNLNSALNKAESNERITNITLALNTIIENGKFLKSSDGKEVELVNATDEDIKSLVDKLIPGLIDATGKDPNEVLKNNLIQALKKTRDELKKVKEDKTVEQDKGDKETTAVRTELATDIMSGKGVYTSEQLKALTGKSWKELWTDPIYIKTIQQFIVDTGAKLSTISDDLLTNGIYGAGTIAGIKTIQTYLNVEYKSDLGTPDGLIGPNTLQELLKPVSDTDKRTRRDKMIDDHKADTLKLTPLDPKNNNKKTEVKPSNKKGIEGSKKEKLLTNKEALKNPKKYNLKLELGSKTKLIPIEGYTWVDKNDKENFTVKLKDQNNIPAVPNNKISNGEKNSISVEKLNKDIIKNLGLKKLKNSDTYTRDNYKGLYFFNNKSTLYYIDGGKNKLEELHTLPKGADKRITHIDREANIDDILNSIGSNAYACAKLIDMCAGGGGTYDIPMAKILNHMKKKKNFISVANAYKELGFSANGKGNLLEMLLKETFTGGNSYNAGYEPYFINFFESLLLTNPGTVKKILLNSNIAPTHELHSSSIFAKRRKNNNIEWNSGKRQEIKK